jgi:predicted PurR-regulated permease PerM
LKAREGIAPALHALSRPLWIIALCSLIGVAYLGRSALVPLALGLLLACVLSGVVETLCRYRVPRGLSAAVLLVLVSLAIGGVIEMTWTPAQQWLQSAPRVLRTIDHKVRPAQSVLQRLDYIAKRATALASSGGETPAAVPPAPPAPPPVLTPIEVFAATGWVVVGTVTVLAFALLLLIAGPPTLARMTAALAADLRAVHVLEIIEAIRLEVGRYYGMMLLINLVFGAVVAGVMGLLGMPNPALWGAIAGVLNFIPYLGSATTCAIVTVVALVTFDTLGQVVLVAGGYIALATVEGHVVEPLVVGRRLDLNPVVVLAALWLGGWLWGIAGVVLALPALVAVKSARRMSSRANRPPMFP